MRTQHVALVFLLLLAGAEAERIAGSASLVRAVTQGGHSGGLEAGTSEMKVPDLDWPGCGSKVGMFKSCAKIEGCQNQKIWLDTWRQKCRYTDAFKLQPEQVPRFLPIELARLEEKSATFARTGCLLGGWLSKCYRRMRQMLRLLKYVRHAMADAKADPSHPAHALASSSKTAASLNRVAEHLSAGFEKHEGGEESGIKFQDAFNELKGLGESVEAAEQKAASQNTSLSQEEEATTAKVLEAEAFLTMTGTKLSDEQRQELFAEIEAGTAEQLGGGEAELDEDIEDVAGELDSEFEAADQDDLETIGAQETGTASDESDPEDLQDPEHSTALLEFHSRRQGRRDSSGQALAVAGTGPLKWIWKNGIKWVVTRIAWLVLFLVGVTLGLFRGFVLFPLLFAMCTITKFVVWLFRDFGYNWLVEGETDLMKSRFKKIAKCGPWMWDTVGFDPNESVTEEIPNQVIMKPAAFASSTTGVHHAYKTEKSLCAKVHCGPNSQCKHGHCYCLAGFYPGTLGVPGCQPLFTKGGCHCKAQWVEERRGWIFNSYHKHYGCPPAGKCAVIHGSCPAPNSLIGRMTAIETKADACTPGPFKAEVAAITQSS